MIKKHLVSILAVCTLFVLFGITSCEDEGISEDQAQLQYNRRDQLNNLVVNRILPLHESFATQTTTLLEKAEAFAQNETVQNLTTFQNEWKNTAILWKQCELYNMGDIEDSFIHTRIDTWATNDDNIEGFIAGSEPIDIAFINSVGSSSKGIAALEYLLFNADISTTLTDFQNDSRRVDYAVALSEDLKNLGAEINGLWIGYGPTFIDAVDSNLEGGQNQTNNAMVTLVEEVIISKLGRALGDTNGGTLNEEEFEAFRSDISLQMIKANLEEVQKTFTGNFVEGTRNIGFDDYIANLEGNDLRDRINASFDVVTSQLDTFSQSLNETLQSNPEKITALQNACNDLLIILRVDMASFIGSTITFNDNDGD
ncbi:imelysin family protein [Ulvibacter litoralis]|uniref:Predicted lipoprotein n=1 Tax=Ulvibacter litoralis TaxID=227084 RepID=A0A1G7CKH9_9FLAO|nr:imelysin family protein [Ulvibacter litoralis]GHC47198.1 hypothetical protein GCM10008083_07930 [Ulvibacter litoralis]SDE39250.1 Predicted lipoprotein [Ulvibacter litoralis]